MKKYAKIIDSKTYEVQLGVGCSDEYYQEIGMTLMEVEQAYNGLWYVAGKAPQESQAEKEQKVRAVRNCYLSMTDFTQLPDAPITTEEKAQYAGYRQYLRDYTNTANWWQQYPLDFDSWKE